METKLYANRIGILKQQEEKARRYVEEMQRRARKIEECQHLHEQQLQVVLPFCSHPM